jgi:hypothetical protein
MSKIHIIIHNYCGNSYLGWFLIYNSFGGIDPDIKLPQSLGINNGLIGCVAEVSFTC